MTLDERMYEYCKANWSKGKNEIARHFLDENVPKTTVYRIIRHYESGLPIGRKPGSGRPAKIMTEKNVKRLTNLINNRSGISTRKLAKKFKCAQSHIVQTIRDKTDVKYRKKILVPARTEKQEEDIRPRCSRLWSKFRRHEFILDDESYFTLSHSDKNSNAGFWTDDKENAPASAKFKTKMKFEKKLLVWVAISPRGISQSFVVPSGLAVNQEIYLKECIIKRLTPFIQKYHSDGNYVFWPDLASSHYAKSVLSHLREKNINFVEKADNPPCVPELRPIENFWSILKGLVYADGWEAQETEQLKKRIKYCLKKVDKSLVQDMVSSVPGKLDGVRRYGIAYLNTLAK